MNPSTKLILSTLLTSFYDFRSASVEHTIDKIAIALRREVFHIGFRLLSGAILASLVVLSFIHMTDAVEALNSQFDNGPVFSLLAFGAATVLCSAGFFFTLRPSPTKPALSATPPTVDLELIALKFAEGIMDGLNQPHRVEKPTGSNTEVNVLNTH